MFWHILHFQGFPLGTERGLGASIARSVSEYQDSSLQDGLISQLKVQVETRSLCKQRMCNGPQLDCHEKKHRISFGNAQNQKGLGE